MIFYKSEKEDTVASGRGGRGCISSRGCVVSLIRRDRQVEGRVCSVCVNSTASRCVSGAKQGGGAVS